MTNEHILEEKLKGKRVIIYTRQSTYEPMPSSTQTKEILNLPHKLKKF